MIGEVGDAEETHRHGTGQRQDHPGHADATGVGNGLDRVGGHEAHQDVRLAEVAQAPGQQRDDGDEGQPAEHVEVGRVLRLDGGHHGAHVTEGEDDEQRRDQQREDHQRGLHGVGPAHRQEAADEHVKDGRRSADPQCVFVGHAEGGLEQPRAGHHARGAVDGEEHQDHQRGEDPQHAALVLEAVREIVRQGQRVVVVLGVHAQATGNEQPVEPGADDQADGDPAFRQAGDEDRAGQAHQQPAAHVRGARRQRGDEATEAAPAEDVVREVLGGTVGDEADQDHRGDVDHESDQSGGADVHGTCFPCVS